MEMEYLVSTEEMQKYDNNTIEKTGISQPVLIERAANAVAGEVVRYYEKKDIQKHKSAILIVAGGGNNGADAIATGRILKEIGFNVDIFVCMDKTNESLEKQKNIAILYEIPFFYQMPKKEYEVIIDGIFGVGLNRVIDGELKELIQEINNKNSHIISVDIPSGIDASTGHILGCAIMADITVTFGFIKRGLYLGETNKYVGIIKKEKIGINEYSFYGTYPEMFTYDITTTGNTLIDLKRDPYGNKGTFGKVLIIAGRNDMSGASLLCAESSLRSGCGMVCVVTEDENAEIIRKMIPEAIVYAYTTKEDAIPKLKKAIDWCDIIAAGPGMGTDEVACEILKEVLKTEKKSIVLDADAITILAKQQDIFDLLCARQQDNEKRGDVIFTPHIKEFSRLMHKDIKEVILNRLDLCREFSGKVQGIVVLKDCRTIICKEKEPIYLNLTGNDAMATAGSGDVLTGLIASIAAQIQNKKSEKESIFDAVCISVYLHGKAGELAAKKTGNSFCIASDIIEQYYNVMK